MSYDIHWPPPHCTACQDKRCAECDKAAGCECVDCPDLFEEKP